MQGGVDVSLRLEMFSSYAQNEHQESNRCIAFGDKKRWYYRMVVFVSEVEDEEVAVLVSGR